VFWLQSTKTLPVRRLRHLRGDEVGVGVLEGASHRSRVGLRRLVGELAVERHVDLHALRSRRLRERLEAELGEQVADPDADRAALDDRRRLARIEVEGEDARPVVVRRRGERRMELDRG